MSQQEVELKVIEFIDALKKEIQGIHTLYLLNLLNQKVVDSINFAKSSSELPDGFMNKFHYISGFVAMQPLPKNLNMDIESADESIERIFSLTDSIFDAYARLWMTRPSLSGSAESEHIREYSAGLTSFLSALFQPKFGTSEQFRNYILAQFEPFDTRYFIPQLGFSIRQCMDLSLAIVEKVGEQYLEAIKDYSEAINPLYETWKQLHDDKISFEEAIRKARETPLPRTRLDENTQMYLNAFTVTTEDFAAIVPKPVINAYFNCFSFQPGTINSSLVYPTDNNELDVKPFMQMEAEKYYVMEAVMLFPILATALLQLITSSVEKDRYYKHRDKTNQQKTVEYLSSVFSPAIIIQEANYGGSNNMGFETDILIPYGRTLIICEVKSKALRHPLYTEGNIKKIKSDFKASVQDAYNQALRTRDFILSTESAVFVDNRQRLLATLKREDFDNYLLMAVTAESFGSLATDLSILLEKVTDAPYPLAISLFDLELFITRINTPEKFIDYLAQRSVLHGKVYDQDELDFAGYYVRYNNLDFSKQLEQADMIALDSSFGSVFDEDWYESHGVPVERAQAGKAPFFSHIEKSPDGIVLRPYSAVPETAPREVMSQLQPKAFDARLKGRDRNKVCSCGSGKKYKKCCGV